MPLMYVNHPAGAFTDAARDALADELTVIGLESEDIPITPFDKSTACVYFRDYPPERIYHGGRPGGAGFISLEVNCFRGGLSEDSKRSLLKRMTGAVRRAAGLPEDALAPIYVIVREVEPANWGVFGGTTTIDELRVAHPDREAI